MPCKACSFVPQGDARAVAWLFSSAWLDEAELQEASRRIQDGEIPDPSRALRDQARQSMGAAPLGDEARKPLSPSQLVALLAANLLLTSLVGLAVWFGLRAERPVAARQALFVSVPVSVAMGAVWAVVWFG